MKISLSGLRELLSGDPGSRESPVGGECPAPERLVLCVRSALPKKEKALILNHIAACPRCARETKGLRAVLDEENKLLRDLEGTGRRARRPRVFGVPAGRPGRLAAAAVLVVILAALAVLSIPRRSPQKDRLRGGAPAVELVSPADKSRAESALKFVWKGGPDSRYFIVEVFDPSLALLWRSGPVFGRELAAPDELARRLKPGETYLWMVTAVPENEAAVKSKLGEFTAPEGAAKVPRSE